MSHLDPKDEKIEPAPAANKHQDLDLSRHKELAKTQDQASKNLQIGIL